jgi:RNA polymerase sigma-70 factor (ECF subfamily)
MARRSYARRRSPELSGLDEMLDLTAAPDLGRLGDRVVLADALSRVGPDHREAVVLHHRCGLSFREVSRALGVSEGAARIRASRGIAALRSLLGGRRG